MSPRDTPANPNDDPALPATAGGPSTTQANWQGGPVVGERTVLSAGTVTSTGPPMIVALVHSGEAELTAGDRTLRASAGDVVVVAPGAGASVTAISDVDGLVVALREEFLAGLLLWMGTSAGEVSWAGPGRSPMRRIGPGDGEHFTKLTRSVRRTVRASSRTGSMSVLAEAVTLLRRIEQLAAPSPRPPLPPGLRRQVEQASRLLWEHPSHGWTVPMLARQVRLSESALTRAFRGGLGITPAAYLREVRLRRFAELLLLTPLSIRESARRSGWSSVSSARAFMVRRYGVPPSEFRVRAWRGSNDIEEPLSA